MKVSINIDDFDDFLFAEGVSSTNRIDQLLHLVRDYVHPEDLWSLMVSGWSCCNDVSHEETQLLLRGMLKNRHEPFADYLEPSCHAWWEQVPSDEPLLVYRGCSRQSIGGLSWTLSKEVAHSFAIGHRGIRLPDPVIVTASIRKSDVLFAINDRHEQEVLLDPVLACEHIVSLTRAERPRVHHAVG